MAFHPRRQLGLSKTELEPFETFLFNRTGFRFDTQRRIALDVAILSRMSTLGLTSSRDYYNIIRFSDKNHEEFQNLISLVTVSETSFFRNRPHFDALRRVILPELIERKGASDKAIRIWSAGCSTGEEPYSVAIVCLEALPALEAWKTEILATDIVKRVIDVAKRGVYTSHSLRQMEPGFIEAYFSKVGPDQYELSPRVRKMVKFLQSDLTREPKTGLVGANWDIIFCRNVLIYFTDEVFHTIIRHFHQVLNPGGFLFLGHAEVLSSVVENQFRLREMESTFVYQKPLEAGGKAPAERAAAASRKQAVVSRPPAPSPNPPQPPAAPEVLSFRDIRELYDHKSYERALEEALRFLQADPNNIEALFIIGKVHADTGRLEEAAEKLRQVTALSPLNAEAYYHLGVVYTRQFKLDAAIDSFKRAIYSDSEFGLAHLNLANVYRQQNRYKEALRSYKNALTALERAPEEKLAHITDFFSKKALMETCRRCMAECREKLGAIEYWG